MVLALVAGCSSIRLTPDEFTTDIPDRLAAEAKMTPAAAADVVRSYLVAQESAVRSPDEHRPPDVITVRLMRSSDARVWEPGVPAGAASASETGALVWLITASGDFVNRTALPWSSPSGANRCGTAIVDDGAGSLLGVYPTAEGGTCGP